MSFRVGDSVFCLHPQHSWVLGSIVAEDRGLFACKVNDAMRKEVAPGEVVEKLKEDQLCTVQSDVLDEKVHDLLNLTILHDATLLRCLYIRYMDDVIYTNIGAIVVALNPFNFNIPRYMDDKMKAYLAEGPQIKQNVPHSWAQAHNTYHEMINDRADQCILISGESGAGKTEATKIVMKYLGAVSCLQGTAEEKAAGLHVGTKLAACSPILEAFGNAKTVRNDNSSRFGKFVRVKFDPNGRLIGAHTTKYLLEKSRIVTAALNERVYHSFYVVLRGKYKKFLDLEMPESAYTSINSGKCLNNKEYDTAEDFSEVCDAMHGLGMSEHEIKSVWQVPAGVLCLQNVTFTPLDEGCALDERNARYLQQVCKQWAIDEAAMRRELLTTTIALPGGKFVTKQNTVTAACDCRDALCKGMYDGVFSWLVEKCNEKCDVPASGNWIGLLDIFGFEDFEKNSFEQLCINLTNETLQNHYNTYIFTKDMDECRAEGIDVTEIRCPDNEPCLRLIAGRGGIIALLDDECSRGEAGTDATFYSNVCSAHAAHPFFHKPKIARDTFVIHHYAASVTYDARGWLDKNRDTLKDAMKEIVRSSPNSIIKLVLPAPVPPEEKKGRQITVGGFFRDQVWELMALINSTNPHWIRCIKPHPAKKPKMFHGVQAMNQLESSGVLGTVKIRKAGYPVRIPNDKFMLRYQMCTAAQGGGADMIRAILEAAGISDKAVAQMGRTKVFLKSQAYAALERFRDECLVELAAFLQRIAAGFLQRKRLFALYVEKHRARLLREKREREERARIEREAAERRRREEEERERHAREAEARRRAEEQRRLEAHRTKCAVALQRHIRGGLSRLAMFRKVLETLRCEFEAARERQIARERADAREIDVARHKAERTWMAYLSEVDELQRFLETEKDRDRKKAMQKERIQKRELERAEATRRDDVDGQESTERWALLARISSSLRAKEREQRRSAETAAKVQQAMQRAARAQQQAKLSPLQQRRGGGSSPRRAAAAAVSDQRTNSLLTEYAVHRARLFHDFLSSPHEGTPVPPPRDSFAARAHAWESLERQRRGTPVATTPVRGSGGSHLRQRELFERSKTRWEREEEWLNSRHQFEDTSATAATATLDGAQLDALYSGPYRAPVADASLSPLAPPWLAATPNASASLAAARRPSPPRGRMTPSQRAAERELLDHIDF